MLKVDHIVSLESFAMKDIEVWHTLSICIYTRLDCHPFMLVRNILVNVGIPLSGQNISSSVLA
jgi:hypothetical protein